MSGVDIRLGFGFGKDPNSTNPDLLPQKNAKLLLAKAKLEIEDKKNQAIEQLLFSD